MMSVFSTSMHASRTEFSRSSRTRRQKSLRAIFRERFLWLGVLASAMLGVLVLNLTSLQLGQSHLFIQGLDLSPQQGITPVRMTRRGKLLDRQGTILALDTVSYILYAHPHHFHDFKPQQIAMALAPLLGESEAVLTQRLSGSDPTLVVAKDVPPHVMDKLNKGLKVQVLNEETETWENVTKSPLELGLDPQHLPDRKYPHGDLACHVLGYVNEAAEIESGVEATLKPLLDVQAHGQQDLLSHLLHPNLANQQGKTLVLDAQSHPLWGSFDALKRYMLPPNEYDVTLTLDTYLQFLAESKLKEGLAKHKATHGAVVMMEPHSGELLAFAAFPNFSPEHYRQYPASSLKNWALSDIYPPGSTMKILTVALGLETGVIQEDSKLLDTGAKTIGGWRIQNYDYHKRPHPGWIDLVYLLHHSSNIGSADIALRIPPKTYYQKLQALGFGGRTGIEVLGESAGLLPSVEEGWDISRRATMGYGYGLSATPLQMVAAVNALANGGVWVPPHVVKSRSLKQLKPHRVFTPETAAAMTRLLTKSISENKDTPANIQTIPVAGKTGTSRKPLPQGGYSSTNLYTSFIGYWPANNPMVTIAVVVDAPSASAWGSTVAAPIFRDITMEAYHYLKQNPQVLRSAKKIEL
ncbi:MAG: peptidoglycan D,D-transpeptidase FtsI family protein [Vampirovibrionales bacterium]